VCYRPDIEEYPGSAEVKTAAEKLRALEER
jgi:hypothetical protein